jgi:hypothetical protein
MEEPQTDARPRPTRGVRLSDLDRSKTWVIGYRGRRWEVLGSTPDCPDCGCGSAGVPSGAGRAAVSTEGDRASAPHTG